MRTCFLFILIFICSDLLFANYARAQSSDTSALFLVDDIKETGTNEFQYSIYLTNTGKVAIPLRGYSWGINLSKELKEGQIGHSYVDRDAALNALPKPNVTFHNSHLRGTTINAAPGDEYLLQPGKRICLATLKVSHSTAWPATCYNPFQPLPGKNPASAEPLQIVTEGGKSQCLISCAGYMIYASANSSTTSAVFGLKVVMQPDPASKDAFKLNCK